LNKSDKWTDSIDINYHTTLLLKRIKNLTKQVFKAIADRGLEEHETNNNINFVLQYLKHNLIILFFSIQEVHKEELEQVISVEDFYLLELALPLADMQQITFASDTIITGVPTKAKEKLSFGFNGDKNKLITVITQLNTAIELLDENSSTTDLLNAFTSKSIVKNSSKIRLGCETVQFRYIIDKLSPYFNNLKLNLIEESELFYTNQNKPLKAQNLSSSKKENPKKKEKIDNIINHLQ
jgi:hypothetical protein